MTRKTLEIEAVKTNEDALAKRELKERFANSNYIAMGNITGLYFNYKAQKWHVEDLDEHLILATNSLEQAIAYFVELEGAELVLEKLNDPAEFEITMDDFAYYDLPS